VIALSDDDDKGASTSTLGIVVQKKPKGASGQVIAMNRTMDAFLDRVMGTDEVDKSNIHLLRLVFESPVRSGFLLTLVGNCNRTGPGNFQIRKKPDWTDVDQFFSVYCFRGLFRTGCNQILDRTWGATGCPASQLQAAIFFMEIGSELTEL
jgi:hypothetical protein